MTTTVAVTAPKGQAIRLKDATDTYLTQPRLGHNIIWTKGHGVGWINPHPGWRGVCVSCAGMVRVAWLGEGEDYRVYEGAMRQRDRPGPRVCNKGIR